MNSSFHTKSNIIIIYRYVLYIIQDINTTNRNDLIGISFLLSIDSIVFFFVFVYLYV